MNTEDKSKHWLSFLSHQNQCFLRAFAECSTAPSLDHRVWKFHLFPSIIILCMKLNRWRFPLIYFYCILLCHRASLSPALHLTTSPLARWSLWQRGQMSEALLCSWALRRGAAPGRDTGLSTLLCTGTTKSTFPCGGIPVLPRGCSASTTQLCLQDQLLKAKISPKCPLKPKPSWKCFLCFLPVWRTAITSAINTVPSVSTKALNGKLLVRFQIIISPCFILSWFPGLHYLLHRVFSYLMGDDSSLLLMVFYKTFPFQKTFLLKSNSMAFFCGLEKPSQIGRTGWLIRLWWSSWQWITWLLKILIKRSSIFSIRKLFLCL